MLNECENKMDEGPLTLSKVQSSTVPATARFDEQVTTGTLGWGFTAHASSSHAVNGRRGVRHRCFRTRGCILAGLREHLVRWWWCDHASHPCSEPQH